jgi:hypothetical protein
MWRRWPRTIASWRSAARYLRRLSPRRQGGPERLAFDYHPTPGPATSRNAIALLKLSGAPESVFT